VSKNKHAFLSLFVLFFSLFLKDQALARLTIIIHDGNHFETLKGAQSACTSSSYITINCSDNNAAILCLRQTFNLNQEMLLAIEHIKSKALCNAIYLALLVLKEKKEGRELVDLVAIGKGASTAVNGATHLLYNQGRDPILIASMIISVMSGIVKVAQMSPDIKEGILILQKTFFTKNLLGSPELFLESKNAIIEPQKEWSPTVLCTPEYFHGIRTIYAAYSEEQAKPDLRTMETPYLNFHTQHGEELLIVDGEDTNTISRTSDTGINVCKKMIYNILITKSKLFKSPRSCFSCKKSQHKQESYFMGYWLMHVNKNDCFENSEISASEDGALFLTKPLQTTPSFFRKN
jgi:hypothetical protein